MLPIIPDPFKLVVRQIKTEDGYKADPTALKQLEVIRKLLGRADQGYPVLMQGGKES